MNDLWAKVCLAVIGVGAIVGAVILNNGQVAASLVTLAGVCSGAIGGVAIQGAFSNPTKSVEADKPDII